MNEFSLFLFFPFFIHIKNSAVTVSLLNLPKVIFGRYVLLRVHVKVSTFTLIREHLLKKMFFKKTHTR